MASREIRRRREKVSTEKAEEIEKKRTRRPLMWAFSLLLLIIITITFVALPVGGKIGYSSSRVVFGSYAGIPIEYYPGNYLSHQRETIAEQMKDQFTDDDNLQWHLYQLWYQAYQNTVVHTALLHEADKSGVFITPDRLDTVIAKYGPYTRNGQFDESLYLAASNSERVATRKLFEENLIHETVVQDLLFSIKTSGAEKSFMLAMASPERSFRYVAFPFNAFPDEQYRAFGLENAHLFTRMKLSRITIRSGERDAKAIRDRILADPSAFEESARSHSQDGFADKGGEMGFREYQELKDDFENPEDLDAVFALARGEIAGPFKTSFGWIIYRCDEPASQPDFSDPDTLASVRTHMNRYEKGKIEDYFTGKAKEFIDSLGGSADSFSSRAFIMGLTTEETPYFPVNYGNQFFFKAVQGPQGSDLFSGVAESETILTALFSLKPGEVSEPLLADEAVLVAVLSDERETPSEELSTLDLYYRYIVQQFQEEHLTSQIFKSELFKDHFMEVFTKVFLSTTQEN
jgi:hypothetical protein